MVILELKVLWLRDLTVTFQNS